MSSRFLRRAALLGACVPSLALGAGLTFGENGAKALSLGGAFAGQADDLTAIQYNPAGLAQQTGFSFLVDLSLLNQQVTFLKHDENGNPVPNVALAENKAGPFTLPFVAAGYGLDVAGRGLTVALGAYGPAAVGRYQFNAPNYTLNDAGRFVENPDKFAPQRYALVKNDTLLAYPGLSAAYQVHPRVAVGASVQYVYSKLYFQQYLTAEPSLRDPKLDAMVEVDMTGRAGTFAGGVGVLVSPVDNLGIGLSFRPGVTVAADGKLKITLGDLIKDSAKVNGDSASLFLSMPMEIRAGAHWKPLPQLGVNADVVYEGWQSFSDLVIEPHGITQQVAGGPETALTTIRIPKRWHGTLSVRGGAEYAFAMGLAVRAGVLFEQQASDTKYFNIDFPNPQRVFLTAGAGYGLGPVELILSGAWTPTQTLTVSDSDVRQVTSNPAVQGNVVGNGEYTSGGWTASLGVRGRFGAPK